jgi:hypothetical protein
MPLRPNLLERVLLHKGIIPSVLLDTGVSMFQASALLTAGDVRLFNHLQEGPLTIEEIRTRTDCSLHGLQVLLTCMMNLGYVDQRGSHYSLTAAMRRSFPIELFPEMVPFFRAVNEKLNAATEAVRTELRTRTVFAHAFLGAIVGGLLVSGIAVIRRKLNDWCRSSTDQQELPK